MNNPYALPLNELLDSIIQVAGVHKTMMDAPDAKTNLERKKKTEELLMLRGVVLSKLCGETPPFLPGGLVMPISTPISSVVSEERNTIHEDNPLTISAVIYNDHESVWWLRFEETEGKFMAVNFKNASAPVLA